MEIRKAVLPILVCAFALMLSINLAQAATATVATLHTTDASGTDKVEFGMGETVHISWTADGTVNIRVEFEDGSIVGGPWLNKPSTGEMDFTPSKTGYYAIYCTGAQTRLIAYGTIFVVPEVPLGTIMAIIASLGALGVFGTVKLKQAKVKIILT